MGENPERWGQGGGRTKSPKEGRDLGRKWRQMDKWQPRENKKGTAEAKGPGRSI